jgi:hypothetical protein
LLIKAYCDFLTDFLVKLFSLVITNVDLNIARKWLSDINASQLSLPWPGDDQSKCTIVISIINTTILSIVYAGIPGLPDSQQTIQPLWGCWEEADGDGGLYAPNVTLMFVNNTAARWVKAAT